MSQLEIYLDFIGLQWMEYSHVVAVFATAQSGLLGSKF